MRRRNLLISSSGGSDDHDFVEIGGLKWATMNIGAEKETDYGLYFQWGDTAGYTSGQCGSNTVAYKKPFSASDFKFNGGRTTFDNSGMTKYNHSDGKRVLDKSDDAARLYWGGDWRMPTLNECHEFSLAVTTAWTTNYQSSGVNGLLCTDKEDSSKTLFFPAGGFCGNGSLHYGGQRGFYWGSTTDADFYAYSIDFNSLDASWFTNFERYYGFSVRPVLDL